MAVLSRKRKWKSGTRMLQRAARALTAQAGMPSARDNILKSLPVVPGSASSGSHASAMAAPAWGDRVRQPGSVTVCRVRAQLAVRVHEISSALHGRQLCSCSCSMVRGRQRSAALSILLPLGPQIT